MHSAIRKVKSNRRSAHKSHRKSNKSPCCKSVVGSRRAVYNGTAEHTSGGLRKEDIVRVAVGTGEDKHYRYRSKKKAIIAKGNPALRNWVKAAKAEGYMVKGEGFRPLPKKGSSAYNRIAERVAKM